VRTGLVNQLAAFTLKTSPASPHGAIAAADPRCLAVIRGTDAFDSAPVRTLSLRPISAAPGKSGAGSGSAAHWAALHTRCLWKTSWQRFSGIKRR
jgi:hypothetical protein